MDHKRRRYFPRRLKRHLADILSWLSFIFRASSCNKGWSSLEGCGVRTCMCVYMYVYVCVFVCGGELVGGSARVCLGV